MGRQASVRSLWYHVVSTREGTDGRVDQGVGGMATAQGTPFGALLKRLRLAADLTQQGLSDRAGVSARAISDLERQPERSPRPETVSLLADALGLEREARAQLQAAAWGGNSLTDVLSARDQRGHLPSHRLPSP